ncbi:MAG: HesA/MoeB/ThiF family protein [Candidatus Bathyarchaeota archaeon]|nr:HesA/MoeB/ThiF family protein [Candidatus Bathyarchaeota archaeon]
MVSASTFDPSEFYKRQTALFELGHKGQEKLWRSKVAIVGAGGLGSASTVYLALAGVGHLRIVDQDTVELSNLHRQILYNLDDLRYPKVEAAAQKIKRMNPEVKVKAIPESVRESNVDKIVEDTDCVVDGLDNMRTRYLLNRACARNGIPYVFGGAIGIEGNLSIFAPPETPCLECILPSLDDNLLPTCETRGVLGATAGIIGTMQAMETIKLLAGIGEPLKGRLMVCDFRDMYFATIDIFKRADCPVCGDKAIKPLEKRERLVWLCGRDTVNVNPPKPVEMELSEAYKALKERYNVLVKSSLVIVFEYKGGIEVSLFNRGRMLIKNVKDEKSALAVYNRIMRELGLES